MASLDHFTISPYEQIVARFFPSIWKSSALYSILKIFLTTIYLIKSKLNSAPLHKAAKHVFWPPENQSTPSPTHNRPNMKNPPPHILLLKVTSLLISMML